MHLRLADYVLWFATPLLQAGVLLAMFRRGLQKEYPFFFNYTILQVVSVPILAILFYKSYTVYYYAYWVNMGLSVLISFAVLQEIFKDAFRPYENLRDLSIILFRWCALVAMLVAVMWAINTGRGADINGTVTDMMMLAERSVRLMQCGLVFFLILFSSYLGLPHRSLLFGISLGFGFFAALNMLVATAVSHQHWLSSAALSRINAVAYLVSVCIWLGYTMATAPVTSAIAVDSLQRSKDWNVALDEVRVVPADSLLDSMDRTVERLLYPPEASSVKISAGPQ